MNLNDCSIIEIPDDNLVYISGGSPLIEEVSYWILKGWIILVEVGQHNYAIVV